MDRSIFQNLGEVEFNLHGSRRLGRLLKVNKKTCLVRPLSAHPSCVHLNALQTKTVKRHLTKHKVTMNLAWIDHIMSVDHIPNDRKYLVFNTIWRRQPHAR